MSRAAPSHRVSLNPKGSMATNIELLNAFESLANASPSTDAFSSRDEYQAVRRLILADPFFARHFREVAGVIEDWPFTISRRFLERVNASLGSAAAVYEDLEHAIYSDTVAYERLESLIHLHMPVESIELGYGLSIRKLSSQEVEEFEQLRRPGAVYLAPTNALALAFEAPKTFVQQWLLAPTPQARRVRAQIEDMIGVIEVVAFGTVERGGTITRPTHWAFSDGRTLTFPREIGTGLVRLDAAACELLGAYGRAIAGLPFEKQETILRAQRRFVDARHREFEEEKLIDLMMAAEALFCVSDGKSKEAKRAVIVPRAACLLEEEEAGQVEIAALFDTAYRERNKVMHGEGPSRYDPPEEWREMTRDVKALMRLCLLRCVALAETSTTRVPVR